MLRFNNQIKLVKLLILFFCNTIMILGQISHQDIVNKVGVKIDLLNTKLSSINKAVSKKVQNNDNTKLISNVQKSYDKLDSKLDLLSKTPTNDNSISALKSLEHLSNIEKDMKRLVQIMLAEQVADITISKSEEFFEESAQTSIEFGLGADFVSRYVWRGTDFGDSPNIQPYISISYSGFELGTWASYPMSASASPDNELDLYLGYSHETNSGDFGAALTDYYFPNAGVNFSNWKSNGVGAHTLELALTYTAPSVLPLTILTAYNVHNDPDKSLYVELSYPAKVSEFDINIFLAGAKGNSGWYGVATNKFEIINLGFSSSKEVSLSENFSFTVNGSYIMNPYNKQTYLVVGLNL